MSVPNITPQLVEFGVRQVPDPILRRPADIVDVFSEGYDLEDKLRQAIVKISALYSFQNGLGLSAPQLGLSKRAIIFGEHISTLTFLANPEALDPSVESSVAYEGCMSFWSYRGKVRRPIEVTACGYERDGRKRNFRLAGVLARVFMHEIDHLNGELYSDKLEDGRLINLKEYDRIKPLTKDSSTSVA